MSAVEPDAEVIETAAIVLAMHSGFPVRVCTIAPHAHKVAGVDRPCVSPGKVPMDKAWQRGDRDTAMGQLPYWLTAHWNVGVCPDGRLIGLDEDVVGGLERFFARVDEPVPTTLGDVVPSTGKRHVWLLVPEGMEHIAAEFGDGNGVKYGEVARKRSRHLVAPGSVWSNGTVTERREWNGIYDVATLSDRAAQLLSPKVSPGVSSVSAQSPQPGDWQWDPEMGSRHDLLVKESRRLAGSIRSETTLARATWEWGELHGLTGSHPGTGRPVTPEEVLDMARGALQKFEADPAPITLIVPTKEAHTQEQQRQSLTTLYDLPYGPLPPPLVRGTFVAAEGWTVLYANGGTGKGLLALWLAIEYLRSNPEKQVAVLDYEGHEWEWGNRARAMGWTDAELRRVTYIDPYSPTWSSGHTLDGLAPELRPLLDTLDVGLVIVDSYTTAADDNADMGGASAAKRFFKGTVMLGVPGIVLAHVTGNERFPSKPWGSNFIHNLARETWALAKNGTTEAVAVKGRFGVTSTVMQVEMRNKKRSVGAMTLSGQVFDIEFDSLGGINVKLVGKVEPSTREAIRDVLAEMAAAGRAGATSNELTAALQGDGVDVNNAAVRQQLSRMHEAGEVESVAGTFPRKYALTEA